MKNKFLILLSILAVMCWAVVAFPSGAQATATLYLTDGVHTVEIADGSTTPGLVDANPNPGAVTWIGTLGTWTLNVSTGTSTAPALSPNPIMDLNSIDSTSAAGQLVIAFSQTGYDPGTATSLPVVVQVSGTNPAGFSMENSVAYDVFNQLLAGTTIAQFTGSGAFANSADAALTGLTGPFSLTETVRITAGGPGGISFDAAVNAVPLPPSALLLGSGLLALVFLRRKSKA